MYRNLFVIYFNFLIKLIDFLINTYLLYQKYKFLSRSEQFVICYFLEFDKRNYFYNYYSQVE